MNPCIVVPYFGTDPRYHKLLDQWVSQFFKLNCACPLAIISDESSPCSYPVRRFDLSKYKYWMRPNQPFDRKGALMCKAILNLSPCLILDADALLMRDPTEALKPFENSICAMPLDLGANPNPNKPRKLDRSYGNITRTCGGVLWSGSPNNAHFLVGEYLNAFQELREQMHLPWSPPIDCLIEQFSWSIALHRLMGHYLPETFNWPPHLCGPNENAIVNHYFGNRKLKS